MPKDRPTETKTGQTAGAGAGQTAAAGGGGAAAAAVPGEERAPITTLALGEEHQITTLVGEHVQPTEELSKLVANTETMPGGVTTVVGEAWLPPLPVTTLAVGEESPTTFAVGEEEGQLTTRAVGEEGPITTIVGEQSSISFTTTMIGEEGPVITTLVGEQHHVPATTAIAGEDVSGGGTGGPFGQH